MKGAQTCQHGLCRKEEAAALDLRAVEAGEGAEDALAVNAPLAIACWCAAVRLPCHRGLAFT